MYNNYKVKVLIFAGRKDTMSILLPQIASDFIDEIIIGVNTTNQDDLAFIYSLKDKYKKITYLEVPNGIQRCTQESFRFFYTKMEDEDTIYFKLDDDLIYIEPGYFEKTLKFRCEHPEYICIYPMIINNPLCNYLLHNDIPIKYNKSNPGEFMFATWKDPSVAEHLLRLFAEFKDEDIWHIKNFEFGKEWNYHLPGGRIIRPSINAICFYGKDFKRLNVKNYQNDDEEFLTNQVFDCGRKSVIFGDTLVAHYAFFTQRAYLNSKNILGLYV